MSAKHLKIDNLKPLSNDTKRKVKKIRCYEVYTFFDNNGEIIEEEIIRELTPKIIKTKHFNQKWNNTSLSLMQSPKIIKGKQINGTKARKVNFMKTVMTKNKIVTKISPFSMSRNSEIRRSPVKNKSYVSSKPQNYGDFYFHTNNKHYTRKNDPVKINVNFKENNKAKFGYGKYPKTYVKTPMEESKFKEKVNLKEPINFIPLSAVPYNNNKGKQSNIIPSTTLNQTSPKKIILSQENCIKIQTFAKGFNITDIQNWVHNNCFLVKMYIPNVTCTEINDLIDSCYNKKMF